METIPAASVDLTILPASTRRVPARPSMGVRYTFLRKEGVELVETGPEDLKQGDAVALRITTNANGYLSVGGAEPVALTSMQPYTTPPVPADQNEVKVVFSRQPQTAVAAAAALVTEVRDRETFVVNTFPAPALAFTITLKRK